jgi:protein-tyrosine phosphatase
MIRILFVCLGNICRSPLAEGVFKHYLISKGLKSSIITDSSGTAGYHIGRFPDSRTLKVAKNHGIEIQHIGRKLSVDDFEDFDYIFAMDKSNYHDIMSLREQIKGNIKAKVLMFRDFDPVKKGDVPDPYTGDMNDFEEVYTICERTSPYILNHIINESTELNIS